MVLARWPDDLGISVDSVLWRTSGIYGSRGPPGRRLPRVSGFLAQTQGCDADSAERCCAVDAAQLLRSASLGPMMRRSTGGIDRLANCRARTYDACRPGCRRARGSPENREDGANPSRSRRCHRGRTLQKTTVVSSFRREAVPREGAASRLIRKPEDLPSGRPQSLTCARRIDGGFFGLTAFVPGDSGQP